jgi:hypothetical protein
MVGRLNIDPLPVALKFWLQSRADNELFPSAEGVNPGRASESARSISAAIDQARAVIQPRQSERAVTAGHSWPVCARPEPQTFLRSVGIDITFSWEGRTRTGMIKVSTRAENCVSTVSSLGAGRSNGAYGDPHGRARVPGACGCRAMSRCCKSDEFPSY